MGHDGVNAPRMSHAVPPLKTLKNTRVGIQTSTNRAKLRRTRNRTIPRRSTPPRLRTRPHDWLQSGLPGLARYQDAVSSIELRNRRAVIVEQTRALKRRLVGDVDPTAQADEDEDERETEDEGEQRRCVIM